MDNQSERAIRRLERLRMLLTGAAVVLVIAIVLLLLLDFGP